MSTKTLRKRIALVAVSALGFGLMSTTPSSAAEANAVTDLDGIFVNTVAGNYSLVQREDVAFTVSVGIDVDADIAADEDITLKAVFTSKPAASTLVGVGTTTGKVNTDGAGSDDEDSTSVDGDGTTAGSLAAEIATNTEKLTDDTNIGSIDFTPDTPGTYVVRVWHDQNADGFYNAGTEVTRTITVVAGGIPASMTIATYGATSSVTNAGIVDDFEDGSFIKVLLKDAAGNATKLAAGEGLTVTGTGTVTLNGTADSITLTSSTSQDISGDYSVNVKKAAVGSSVVTIAPAGTIASAFASQTSTLSFVAVTEQDVVAGVINETTGVDATAAGTGASPAAIAAATTKTSVAYKLTTANAQTSVYVAINIVDTTGSITGVAGASYTEAVLTSDTAAGTAAYSVTPATWSATTRAATGATGADAYTIAVADDTTANSLGWTVTATTPANSAANSSWNISSVSAVAGGSVSATLTVKDQFGLARSGQAVVFAIAGRNVAITTGLNAVTDATGKATFTYTDTGTATSATTDTISASAGGTGVTATVAVSFDAGNAVSTVVVNSGDTTDGVANLSPAFKDILAGTGGPTTSANDVTATVKNAAGTALAGVSVTFTVAGTGCAIPSNEVTVFTGATGIATSAVYAWLAGKCTVTATAGGKTGTGVTSFRQETGTETRTIAATVAGTVITVTPKDRFGNPIIGDRIYAVVTAGNGYFGSNGARSTYADTLADGTVSFVVAGGDASVRLTTIDPSGSGLALDQSTAAVGFVAGDVATPVAFTATTTGTTTTAETGVGASFAPAGISSVTVEVTGDQTAQAAVDAAAEATDAANAATDAANAAAEAADAATAAAQDAADAVAALSTSVSEMISALKKQITSLTNLVIKIQKKVRA